IQSDCVSSAIQTMMHRHYTLSPSFPSSFSLLPTSVLAEIVVYRGIALEVPDDALSVPPLVQHSVQEAENLAPRRLGLGGTVAAWHGVVQEAVGRLSIDADVKALSGAGQHIAHAQHIGQRYEVVQLAKDPLHWAGDLLQQRIDWLRAQCLGLPVGVVDGAIHDHEAGKIVTVGGDQY